jgi:hypothetical protein
MGSFGRLLRLAGLAVAVLSFGGCATKFDPGNAAHIQTIALTGFAEPGFRAQFRMGLNISTVTPSGPDRFADLLATQNLHLGAEMKAALAAALRADGYQIVDGPADAVLDVTLDGAPPMSEPLYEAAFGNFEPEYATKVKLTDSKSGKTLFSILYLYRDNTLSPMDGSILIRPDPKYSFASADALFADPALAAQGFRAPIATIAQSVGTFLKKP